MLSLYQLFKVRNVFFVEPAPGSNMVSPRFRLNTADVIIHSVNKYILTAQCIQ